MKALLLALLVCGGMLWSAPLKIGWAYRDISTKMPVNIPGQGYRRISEGVADPILTTVVVFDDGKEKLAFISSDLLVMRCSFVPHYAKAIAEAVPEIPEENLIFNCTHDHTSTALYPNGDDVNHEQYLFVCNKMVEAVKEAWSKRAPGGVARGSGYAVTGIQRRVVYSENSSVFRGPKEFPTMPLSAKQGVMYGNVSRDQFMGYDGQGDATLNILFTFDNDNQLTGAIINTPCPAQCNEGGLMLSADYWHNVRQLLRAKYGENFFVLPQIAAAGDLSPHERIGAREARRRYDLKYGATAHTRQCERQEIAERIVGTFGEVFEWARKDIRKEQAIQHHVIQYELPRIEITDAEYEELKQFVKDNEKSEPGNDWTPEEKKRFLDKKKNVMGDVVGAIVRHERRAQARPVKTEMHVATIGDAAFVTFQGELFVEYMQRIQGRSPFGQTFIIECAGSRIGIDTGYLATERSEAIRGYSANLACNEISYRGIQMMVDGAVDTLKKMKKNLDK